MINEFLRKIDLSFKQLSLRQSNNSSVIFLPRRYEEHEAFNHRRDIRIKKIKLINKTLAIKESKKPDENSSGFLLNSFVEELNRYG